MDLNGYKKYYLPVLLILLTLLPMINYGPNFFGFGAIIDYLAYFYFFLVFSIYIPLLFAFLLQLFALIILLKLKIPIWYIICVLVLIPVYVSLIAQKIFHISIPMI